MTSIPVWHLSGHGLGCSDEPAFGDSFSFGAPASDGEHDQERVVDEQAQEHLAAEEAVVGQRARHTVHIRDGVQERSDRQVGVLFQMARTGDVLDEVGAVRHRDDHRVELGDHPPLGFHRGQSGLGETLGIEKQLVAVENTRGGISKASMVHNDATPHIEVDPETYEVRADGELLTCEPAEVLPMAQRYFLF